MPTSSQASDLDSESPRCSDVSLSFSDWSAEPRLRGLRWRVLLGVLPSCPASIESLRRAAANGRRRYAELRRRLIVDPHTLEAGQKMENLSVNNPLSQDPDSAWRHYFNNTELEKSIENDLTRLYPEHGSFFLGFSCQLMLKRILLVWALSHPQYGYRQGMHEVLAPLVYVLHLDVAHLSQVRQRYEDPFEDRFDGCLEEKASQSREGRQAAASFSPLPSLHVSDDSNLSGGDEWVHRVHPDDLNLVEPDDFGFNLKTMVMGSDGYGAEGELGALLSGRFMEHDAYCMLDALLSGQNGAVALADYFLAANEGKTGISPVMEASATMYHTLAAIDMPLYIHLVEIGVEPQFFALRWFRVLFGREFELEMLLHVWDAIFSAPHSNGVIEGNTKISGLSFIAVFALSMILYLRSTLLAAPTATVCLQKLLNFPKHVDVRNLIASARVLQMIPDAPSIKAPLSTAGKHSRFFAQSRGSRHKSRSLSPSFHVHVPSPSKVLQHRHSGSPEIHRHARTESYWEEQWMSSNLTIDGQEEMCGDGGDRHVSDNVSQSNVLEGHGVSDVAAASAETISNQNVSPNGASSANGITKPAKRNLFTAFWKGAAQLMSFEERKVDATAVSRSETKTSESIETSRVITPENERADVCGAEVCPDGVLATGEGTLEVAGSGIWTSDDGETSSSGDEGARSHGTVYQNLDVDERKLAHPLEVADRSRNSNSSNCHQGSEPNSMSREGTDILLDERVETEAVDTTKEPKDGTVTRERHSKAVLQSLGHSMVESIQVIESALSGLTKDGAATAYRETTENLSKSLLNGKGHLTALSALAELRKISSLLLQM